MSLGNLRLSRPPKPPFYDRELEPPARTITIPAAVAKRIAAALDPNDPIYPEAVQMLTGISVSTAARVEALAEACGYQLDNWQRNVIAASIDRRAPHGMPRPLAALS